MAKTTKTAARSTRSSQPSRKASGAAAPSDLAPSVLRVGDKLVNIITGMGTDRDKSMGMHFRLDPMTQDQVETAYRSDWISRKIVDIPARDAFREWRSWQADARDITQIEALESALGIQKKAMTAFQRGRLYGGGALVLGVDQGRSEDPLDVENVQKGQLKFVHCVSRHDISPGPIEWNILSPYFGQPSYYDRINTTSGEMSRFHPSRIVRFLGAEAPNPQLSQGWGDSVLQVCYDAVLACGLVASTIAQLVSESKIDTIAIPELSEKISSKVYENRLQQRFALANTMKSTFGMLIIDKEEDWKRIEQNFTSLPDVLKIYLLIVCGAADIPATRFLGQSPTGLSATGESDTRNYYDRTATEQKMEISPALSPLDQVLVRSALGEYPEGIFYNWNPLWQMTEAEKADIASKKATVMTADVNAALIPPDVLREARINQLIEDGTYPGLEQIYALSEAQAESEDETDPPEEGGSSGEDDSSMLDRIRRKVADAQPRQLYIRRDVLNAEEIRAHYKAQGLEPMTPADQMHVTIIYTTNEVDWMKVEDDHWVEDENGGIRIKQGGPRMHDIFGPGLESRALVLMFTASSLSYRHMRIRELVGATVSYEDYQPHITLTYHPAPGLDPSSLEPWRGEIVLGPEIFEAPNEDFRSTFTEDAE